MHTLLIGMMIIKNIYIEKSIYEKGIESLTKTLSAGIAVTYRWLLESVHILLVHSL